MTCPDYCLSATYNLPFCMFQRGCPVGMRTACQQPHTRDQNEAKVTLGLRTKRNGLPMYDLCCLDCGRRIRHLSRKAFNELIERGKRIEFAPPATVDTPVCIVRGCTTAGYEYHHFAPINVFGFRNADRWPCLQVCKPHHTAWHQAMSGFRWDPRELPETAPERVACFIYMCAQRGTQILRLAPKSRFDRSDDWPVIPVCGSHYQEYNQTMDGYVWGRKSDSSNEYELDTSTDGLNQHRYWKAFGEYLRSAR